MSPNNAPSSFQLAFALAIVKSKPVGITMREYLSKIRKHILDGAAAQDYGSQAKYIDAAGHWQSMHQNAQHEIERLQMKVLSLECDKVQLESKISMLRRGPDVQIKEEDISRPSTPQPRRSTALARPSTAQVRPSTAQSRSSAPKKRKNPFKDNPQLQHKQLKTTTSDLRMTMSDPIGGQQNTPIVIDDDLRRFDEPKGLEPTITRHLLNIHKLYQKDTYDCLALAYHLVQATRGIAQQITSEAIDIQNHLYQASLIKDQKTRSQRVTAVLGVLYGEFSKQNGDFSKSKRAAARSFVSLYHGLYTMWDKGIESGKRNHGIVTYEMIAAFDAILIAIETCCAVQAKMTGDEDVKQKSKGAPVAEGTKKRKDRRVDTVPVPQELTTLLLALLSGLDPEVNGPHSAFFEGCLYLLLDRVAKKLFMLTFKHEPCASIEEEIALGDVEETQVDSTTLKAAKLEVQFLVQLVDRAMTLALGFLGSLPSTSAASKSKTSLFRPGTAPKSNTKTSSQKPQLSIVAKERLQQTLVRCMFGGFPKTVHGDDSETEDEEDGTSNSEFVDALRKPLRMGPVPSPPTTEEAKDIPNWFREEIWRLVGWDILSRNDGW